MPGEDPMGGGSGGGNQMDESKSDPTGMQARLLGPDYNYSKQIKPPGELGMSSEGSFDVLADDIGGLIAYVNVLVTGKGKASRTGQPLGTKFFLPTSMNCTDVETGNDVTRSIYVNNVPDGTIPFISEAMGGEGFDEFRGLLPGVMSNLAQINPLQILQAFVNGPSPNCQAITMETIHANNVKGRATGYVTNTDINVMNPDWFTIPGFTSKPDTSKKPPESESFTTMHANSTLLGPKTLKASRIDYGAMPNDFFIKVYLSSLGLLGLYFFMKMAMKRRLK